jgi:two-component system, NtrC family, sensor histidine kinase HydH
MPSGGRLLVSTRVARDELSFWREGARRSDLVEIRFRDSGPGIADDARENIFVPFYTTKEKGTGLGLAICQRLVKAHGGSIGVRSATGEGAEFLIALPGLREERPPEPNRKIPDAAERARLRELRRTEAQARLRRRKRRKKKQRA